MAGFTGMDIMAVRHLASQLMAKADEIDSVATALSGQLNGVQWIGMDAEAFRSDWHSTHLSQLRAVSSALREASSRATSNANQQEEASSH